MESHKESLSGKENEIIHGILVRILEKWRMEIGAAEEDLEKTVIISSERAERKEIAPSPKPVEVTEEVLSETVIISPMGSGSRISTPPPAVKLKAADPIQKPQEPSGKDEFLQETVILKTGKVRDKVNE